MPSHLLSSRFYQLLVQSTMLDIGKLYYPYVVGSASYNNVKRTAVIKLSRISEIERKSEYNPEGADYYRELLQEEMNKYSE